MTPEIPKEVLEKADKEAENHEDEMFKIYPDGISISPWVNSGVFAESFEKGYLSGYSSRDEEVKELREALEFYARDRILVARLSKSLMGISEWFQQHPAREVLEKWKEK